MTHYFKKASVRMLIGMLAVLAVAATALQLHASGETSHGYKLEDAWAAAKARNAELQMIDERIVLAEARHQEALKDAYYAANKSSLDKLRDVEFRKQELVLPLSTEADLTELKQQKEDLLVEVRLQVEGIFYRYALIQEQHRTALDEMAAANEKYEAQKKLVETGKAIPSSLDAFEIERLQLEQKLSSLESERELLFLDLSTATGITQKSTLALVPRAVPAVNYKLDNAAALSKTLRETHVTVALAQKRADIAAQELKLVQKAYEQDHDLADQVTAAEDGAYSARLALRDAQDQVEVQVRSDYNSILNFEDDVVIGELEQDRSRTYLNMAEKQFELGMITNTELSQARIQAQQAEAAWVQAKLNHYNAVERYKHFISSVQPAVE